MVAETVKKQIDVVSFQERAPRMAGMSGRRETRREVGRLGYFVVPKVTCRVPLSSRKDFSRVGSFVIDVISLPTFKSLP